jgi:hypothetical protein
MLASSEMVIHNGRTANGDALLRPEAFRGENQARTKRECTAVHDCPKDVLGMGEYWPSMALLPCGEGVCRATLPEKTTTGVILRPAGLTSQLHTAMTRSCTTPPQTRCLFQPPHSARLLGEQQLAIPAAAAVSLLSLPPCTRSD